MRYEGRCRNLHGHNGLLEIVLSGARLDARGMVADFSLIKRKIKEWIDQELDHRMLLCRKDKLAPSLKKLDPAVRLFEFNPTAENLARYIYQKIRAMSLPVVEVRLWETPSSCALYRGNST